MTATEEDRTPWPLIPGETSALDRKRELGMSDEHFARSCDRVIGRPGPSTVAEDRIVLRAMDAARERRAR